MTSTPSALPSPPTLERLARVASRFNLSPPLTTLGLRMEFPTLERTRAVLDPVARGHRGGLGTEAVNGGVMAAMFDLAIGCTPMLLDPQRKSATQQLSITFQRPTLGNRVWCEAFLQHAGRSTLSCAAEIIDEWGVVWARHGIGQARPRQLVRGPPGPFLRGAPGGG